MRRKTQKKTLKGNPSEKQKKLLEQARMSNSLLNAVGAGLSLIDKDMRIVWVNKILSQWFGKLKDIKGKFCYKTYQRRNHICPGCPSHVSFRTGRTQIAENQGINVKGETRDYLLTTVPIFERKKEPRYVLELTQDITEKKQLEKKLLESEDKLKNIFGNIHAAIFVISPDYSFSYMNQKAYGFFKLPRRTTIRCCDIFSPGGKWMGCPRCQIKECFENKRTLYYEFSFAGKTFSSMLTPILDHQGNVTQLIEISLDISDFKDLQLKLKDSEELATIGKITAGIAHEIRNPLFGIASITQILSKKELDKKEKSTLTDAMLFETERLNHLLEDLLILSSRKSHAFKLKNPHSIINEMLSSDKVKIQEKSLRVRKNFNGKSKKVRMDERQIKLLFQNLLDNAVEASRKNGTIYIYTGYTPGKFIMRIKNSGEYITRDELDKVFEPFFSKKTQGTGLGLSICKRIIKDINGMINVSSNRKRTEFEVTIPI